MTERTSSSSPKSSIISSSPQPAGSAHPHFFQRHFHSKSTSSPTSTETQPDPNVITATVRTEAVRDAKRFLLSAVRDDWSYPQIHITSDEEVELREPIDYRHREEGLSDLEPDSDEPTNTSRSSNDPYRFESPDAIATSMLDRRRKRRRIVYEEMQWNEGLRVFLQRRDAWTGAVTSRPRSSRTSASKPLSDTNGRHHSHSTDTSLDSRSNLHPDVSTQYIALSPAPSEETYADLSNPDNSQGPLLPVYPPLLPASNPIRSSIKPAIYPAIYSKVVIQSLTPTVPIPLPVMVSAMVQGWKAEGNWPPKSTVPTPMLSTTNKDGIPVGARRHAHMNMLRFRRSAHDPTMNGQGEVKGRGGRKGVGGVVRKALGLKNDDDPGEEELDGDCGTGLMEFEDQKGDADAAVEVHEEKSGNMSDSIRVD